MKLTLRQRINKGDANFISAALIKKDWEITLKDFTVNVPMICQVVYHSKAIVALDQYIIIEYH